MSLDGSASTLDYPHPPKPYTPPTPLPSFTQPSLFSDETTCDLWVRGHLRVHNSRISPPPFPLTVFLTHVWTDPVQTSTGTKITSGTPFFFRPSVIELPLGSFFNKRLRSPTNVKTDQLPYLTKVWHCLEYMDHLPSGVQPPIPVLLTCGNPLHPVKEGPGKKMKSKAKGVTSWE